MASRSRETGCTSGTRVSTAARAAASEVAIRCSMRVITESSASAMWGACSTCIRAQSWPPLVARKCLWASCASPSTVAASAENASMRSDRVSGGSPTDARSALTWSTHAVTAAAITAGSADTEPGSRGVTAIAQPTAWLLWNEPKEWTRAGHRRESGAVIKHLTLSCRRPLRFPSPHADWKCKADAVTRHRVVAIEVRQHDGSGICVRHDHLWNEGREHRQQQRPRHRTRDCRDVNGQHVARHAQPTESDRGLVNHRPWTEQSPVEPASGTIARS